MKTPVHAIHGVGYDSRIGYIADDNVFDAGHIIAFAGRQIVENTHRMARRHQRVHKMRADKSAAAGNEICRQ